MIDKRSEGKGKGKDDRRRKTKDEELRTKNRQQHLQHGVMILDAMIGATAVASGLPLYTFNEKHYRAIPSLSTIQPYVRSPRTPGLTRKGN
jgi:predicted nucleic acid-binding protein